MAKEKETVVKGISFTQLLTIAFIVLKLTKVITWSWWWVFAPLWIPVGIGVIIFLVALIFYLIFGSV